jgi:hypothetical protein
MSALLLALDFLHLGTLPLLKSSTQPDPSFPLSGIGRMGASSLILDCVHLEVTLSLKSSACMGSVLAALDLVHPGASSFLRSFA